MGSDGAQATPTCTHRLSPCLPPVGAGLALPSLPSLALPNLFQSLPARFSVPPCMAHTSGALRYGNGSGKPDPYGPGRRLLALSLPVDLHGGHIGWVGRSRCVGPSRWVGQARPLPAPLPVALPHLSLPTRLAGTSGIGPSWWVGQARPLPAPLPVARPRRIMRA